MMVVHPSASVASVATAFFVVYKPPVLQDMLEETRLLEDEPGISNDPDLGGAGDEGR
jgi:hypothetical protein